jgi:hypothetical protein
MIKAIGVMNGRPTLLLGLSRGNLQRFLDEPDTYIPIPKEELDTPFDIIICGCESEQAMHDQLKASGAITPQTKVYATEQLKEEGFKP